jgi:hypothetical protein
MDQTRRDERHPCGHLGPPTYEHADHWQGDHRDGVRVFVLTNHVPGEPPPGSVRYSTDVAKCADLAGAAASEVDVTVMGAAAAQALLRVGRLDELELHVVPVLPAPGTAAVRQLRPRAHRAHVAPPAGRRTMPTSPSGVLPLRYRVEHP